MVEIEMGDAGTAAAADGGGGGDDDDADDDDSRGNIWKLLSMLEPQPGSMGFARDVPGQLEETLADFVAALLKPGQHI